MSYKAGTVVIDIKADTASLVTGMQKAEKSVGKAVENIKNTVFTLVSAYAGLQTAQKLVGDGFRYNMKLEEAKTGLISLSVAVQDKTIPVMERYARANIEATETLIELQRINAQTPHTLDQTNQIYKAMYVSMKNAGASTSDMIELTRSISIAAGAGGIEFNSLLAGVDGLATGTVLANSDLGRFISSLGLTNEALKKSDDVVTLLKENLKDFKSADLMSVALSNLENSWNSLSGELTKDIFKSTKDSINELSSFLDNNKDDILEFSDNITEASKIVAIMGGSILIVTTATKTYTTVSALAVSANALLGGSFGAVNRSILLATASTRALSLATKSIPFVAVAGAIALLIQSFNDSARASDELEASLSKTGKALGELTKAELEYRKQVLLTSYQDAKIKAFELLRDTQAKSFMESKLEQAEDLKNYELAKQKVLDISSAYDEVTKALLEYKDEASKAFDSQIKEWNDMEAELLSFSKNVTELTAAQIKHEKERQEAENALYAMGFEIYNKYIDDKISKHSEFDSHVEKFYARQDALQKAATELTISDTEKINTKYLEMYDAIDGIFDDSKMQKFFKSWEDSLADVNKESKKYEGVGSKDWTAGLEGSSKQIANFGNAFADIATEQEKWLKFNKENTASDKDKEKHLENQLMGYSNMTGAVANMYEEGSKEAAAFNAIQNGLALSAAIGSIASAGIGDPYTAIPRVIAMTAMMASTLSNIGVALGTSNTTTTTSYDAGAAQVANTGIGSVLGDVTAQSESMQNSLEILSDYAKPEYALLSNMNNSLIGIYAALSGVSSNIVKQGGFSFGSGFSGYSGSTKSSTYEMMSFATAFSDVLSGAHITAEVDKMVQDAFGMSFGNDLISDVAGFFSGANVSNAIIEGIFGGGSSTSKALADAGLTFQSQLIEAAIGGLSGNSYQTIKTTVKKDGGWFSSDSETISYNTSLSGLDSETKTQFELILSNLYDTVLTAGDALGIATDETKNELSDFYVNIGKISLKGKSGEQIQDTLTAIFGKIGDDLAKDAFPILEQFQQVGEGFFETVSRVATDVQVVSKSLEKVGFDISSNQIIISESLVSLSGSLTTFADLTSSYYDDFFTDAEKLEDNTKFLTDFFNTLGYQLPETKEGFRAIVDSLDLTTTAGQESYLSILSVSDTFLDFSDALEDANDSVSDISSSLLAFANNLLYVNNVATAGYESSMILLNNSISSFSGATDKASASADIQTYANNAISYIGSKSSSLAEQRYQTAVIGNQIKDLAIQNDTGSFKTVEDAINEMKNAVVAELQDIRTNTEREYG